MLNYLKKLSWVLYVFRFNPVFLLYIIGRSFGYFGFHKYSGIVLGILSCLVRSRFVPIGRCAFNVSHLIDFWCNKSRYYDGHGHSYPEPLIECSVSGFSNIFGSESGVCDIEFSHLGLRVLGYAKNSLKRNDSLEILINGIVVRKIPLHSKMFFFKVCHFHIKREVLNKLPKIFTMELRTIDGGLFNVNGSRSVELKIPHGDGSIFDYLEAGGRIDKKGFLALTPDTIHARQARYLDIYSEARKYFTEQFGSPLFVMYGTLLGLIREGDFIQGDDDFDAGYISRQTNAKAVKQETMQLVVDMVLAGFTCSFNRNGRLFRLRLKDDKPDVHLDVRPVWYEEEHIWAHKQARLPLKVEDFLPVETRELRGVPVDVPRNAEGFLRAYYGPGWKVPDPGYSNASQKVPRRVKRKLNSVCITPKDYQGMQQEIEERRAEHPNAGKLIATGLHPLYPLEEYEANCEW